MLEAFLKLLNGEHADQIVWTANVTYWIAGQQQAGTARSAWKTEEGCLQLHKELGILPYYYYEKFWASEPRYAKNVELINEKAGDTTTRRFRTPVGELCEEKRLFAAKLLLGRHEAFCGIRGRSGRSVIHLTAPLLGTSQPGRLAPARIGSGKHATVCRSSGCRGLRWPRSWWSGQAYRTPATCCWTPRKRLRRFCR